MNAMNMGIIRAVFRICYYYIMSFLITPLTFTSGVLDSFKSRIGHPKKEFNTVSYHDLITEQIKNLRQILIDDCDTNHSTETTEARICERCNSESICSEDEEDNDMESKLIEFTDGKIYSLKVDTIGKYDLREQDVDISNGDRSHIHINIKRRTVDIVSDKGTNRLPLRPNQIVVSDPK